MSEFGKALEGLHWEGVLVEYDSAMALGHVSSVASALRWLGFLLTLSGVAAVPPYGVGG
jgi:hypothetical protein